MIVLSVGMPRAGSGWHYNLIHDLVLAGGGQDARQIRQRYRLQRVLSEVNCNIGALTAPRLLAVSLPALLGNTFAIKAHAGPTPLARRMIARGWLRTTYIYRDPRDAILSAIEYGRRGLANGRTNAFSHLNHFPAALEFLRTYLGIWQAWMNCPQVLSVRYEDLLGNYPVESERLLEFLRLDPSRDAIQAVVERYRPAAARAIGKGVHFSKGKVGRHREALAPEEQGALSELVAPYLERMGYAD